MQGIVRPHGIGKCHGKARFAAQFRRTQRPKTDPYSQANARELFVCRMRLPDSTEQEAKPLMLKGFPAKKAAPGLRSTHAMGK
jgi:hypothetical protein